VALPADVATRLVNSKRKADFIRRGIGVLAVNVDRCRVALRAKKQISSSEKTTQAYSVERFWLPHLKDSETCGMTSGRRREAHFSLE